MATTNPASTRAEFQDVLEQVTAATRLLRTSDQVPAEVERLIEELDTKLHADTPLRLEVDPYLSTMLFAGALRALKATRHDNLVNRRRDVRLALEQLRHALRDLLEAAPFAAEVPAREVLRHVADSLNVSQADLAELLGVSTRQLQRWLSPDGPPIAGDDEARVRIVAELVNHLRHVFTAPGVAAWFRRAHPHLGGPPLELLDDPSAYPRLRELAGASRAMAG